MKPLTTILLLFISGVFYAQLVDSSDAFYIVYEPDTSGSSWCENGYCEFGTPCGYINQEGDTIISIGKYNGCYTNSFTHFAIVSDANSGLIAIDPKENVLFHVHVFDNGPDNVHDGLFRIWKGSKTGFANLKGEIVIELQYECADFFKNGRARVTENCTITKDGEYHAMNSDTWYYIDTLGNRIDKK